MKAQEKEKKEKKNGKRIIAFFKAREWQRAKLDKSSLAALLIAARRRRLSECQT